MIYDWYKIFNYTEFLATGLVSRSYQLYLNDIGLKDILVTKGNLVGMLVDDIFLCVGLNDMNPFEYDDRAIYKDANNDVWYGVAVED